MAKVKSWFKKVFSLDYLARFLAFIVGACVNMLCVYLIFRLGRLMIAETSPSIIVGSFFAYPLAKLANKYAYLGFKKLFKV